MDLLQLGAQLLKSKLGNQAAGQDVISSALGGLLGAQNGQLDIGKLVQQLAGNAGVQAALKSMLGGGQANINPAQILEMFGAAKLGGFADQIGVSQQAAAGGLADVLPQLISQAGGAGNLLQGLGGLLGGGAQNAAGGLGDVLGGALGGLLGGKK